MTTYTVKQASKLLNCCSVKVYELIQQGEITPIAKIGKKIIIPEVSINAFLLGVKISNIDKLKILNGESNIIKEEK